MALLPELQIKAGMLVRVRSSIGNIVKAFVKFPGKYDTNHAQWITNRAQWIDVDQIGIVVEVRKPEDSNIAWCKTIVPGGCFWFDDANLQIVSKVQ
jgi:hypothetical protein